MSVFAFPDQFACSHCQGLSDFFRKGVSYVDGHQPVEKCQHFLQVVIVQAVCGQGGFHLSDGLFALLLFLLQKREQRGHNKLPLFGRTGFHPLMERMVQQLCFPGYGVRRQKLFTHDLPGKGNMLPDKGIRCLHHPVVGVVV